MINPCLHLLEISIQCYLIFQNQRIINMLMFHAHRPAGFNCLSIYKISYTYGSNHRQEFFVSLSLNSINHHLTCKPALSLSLSLSLSIVQLHLQDLRLCLQFVTSRSWFLTASYKTWFTIMGKFKASYLALKTGPDAADLISSDLQDLGHVAKKLANHAVQLALGFSLGTVLLQWIASVAAIYLLILDRTNWKTNILTSLLIPYIFFSFPSAVFQLFRGDVGKWIAFIAVVLRLFFPQRFPDWLELPGALILLMVAAPSFLADYARDNIIGVGVCLVIGCYLLQEHIRASGGFRNSFTRANGISNSIGIIIILVYPVWALIVDIV